MHASSVHSLQTRVDRAINGWTRSSGSTARLEMEYASSRRLWHASMTRMRYLRLLEEERTVDARIPKLYYDVLQIAVTNRNQAKAKVIPLRLDS